MGIARASAKRSKESGNGRDPVTKTSIFYSKLKKDWKVFKAIWEKLVGHL